MQSVWIIGYVCQQLCEESVNAVQQLSNAAKMLKSIYEDRHCGFGRRQTLGQSFVGERTKFPVTHVDSVLKLASGPFNEIRQFCK